MAKKPNTVVEVNVKPVAAKAPAKSASRKKAVAAFEQHEVFVFAAGARPSSGPRLFAHTAAALKLLGMENGRKVPRESLVTVVGDKAVKYHTEGGNMERDEGNIGLTKAGITTFAERKVDASLVQAFLDAFQSKKSDTKHAIHARNLVKVGLTY